MHIRNTSVGCIESAAGCIYKIILECSIGKGLKWSGRPQPVDYEQSMTPQHTVMITYS